MDNFDVTPSRYKLITMIAKGASPLEIIAFCVSIMKDNGGKWERFADRLNAFIVEAIDRFDCDETGANENDKVR